MCLITHGVWTIDQSMITADFIKRPITEQSLFFYVRSTNDKPLMNAKIKKNLFKIKIISTCVLNTLCLSACEVTSGLSYMCCFQYSYN